MIAGQKIFLNTTLIEAKMAKNLLIRIIKQNLGTLTA
jgi:hypothetical protein